MVRPLLRPPAMLRRAVALLAIVAILAVAALLFWRVWAHRQRGGGSDPAVVAAFDPNVRRW